jgi:hypothetical protein
MNACLNWFSGIDSTVARLLGLFLSMSAKYYAVDNASGAGDATGKGRASGTLQRKCNGH